MFGGLLESLSLAQTVLVVVGTLLVSQLEDGPQPVHAGRRITSLILVSIQRIRSLLESLSWFKPLLESLSWCQPLLVSAIVVSIQRIRSLIVRRATKPVRIPALDWCANPAPSCGFDWVS